MEGKITFGKFICEKRKQQHLTQRELAEKIYVTESAVSKWERGLSYPDITLVSSICEALCITEHELITASDDIYQKKVEKQARNFTVVSRAYRWTMYFIYGISLLTCFICNLAVNHTLSWFFIVLTAEAVAFSLTSVPGIVHKNRAFWTFAAFCASLAALLFTCQIYTGGDWFLTAFVSTMFGLLVVFAPLLLKFLFGRLPAGVRLSSHITLLSFIIDTLMLFLMLAVTCSYAGYADRLWTTAYPIAVYGSAFAWIFMLIIRYVKMNPFFKAAVCSFITAPVIFISNNLINTIVEKESFVLPTVDFTRWDTEALINGNSNTIVALCFAAAGFIFLIGAIVCEVIKYKSKK